MTHGCPTTKFDFLLLLYRDLTKLPDHHSFLTWLATNRKPATSYARCTVRNSVLKIPATITTPLDANRARIRSRALISRFEIRFAQMTEYLGPVRESFVTSCSTK